MLGFFNHESIAIDCGLRIGLLQLHGLEQNERNPIGAEARPPGFPGFNQGFQLRVGHLDPSPVPFELLSHTLRVRPGAIDAHEQAPAADRIAAFRNLLAEMFRGDKAGEKTETMRAPAGTARGGVARGPIDEQPDPGDDPEIHGVDPTCLHLDLMELPDQQ